MIPIHITANFAWNFANLRLKIRFELSCRSNSCSKVRGILLQTANYFTKVCADQNNRRRELSKRFLFKQNIVEKPRKAQISLKFVCITFSQYCTAVYKFLYFCPNSHFILFVFSFFSFSFPGKTDSKTNCKSCSCGKRKHPKGISAPIAIAHLSCARYTWCGTCHVMYFKRVHRVETQQILELMTVTWSANIFVGCSVTPTFFWQITFFSDSFHYTKKQKKSVCGKF